MMHPWQIPLLDTHVPLVSDQIIGFSGLPGKIRLCLNLKPATSGVKITTQLVLGLPWNNHEELTGLPWNNHEELTGMLLWLLVYINGLQNRLIFEVIIPPGKPIWRPGTAFPAGIHYNKRWSTLYLRNGTRYHLNYNGYPPYFRGPSIQKTIANSTRPNRKSEIQDGGR